MVAERVPLKDAHPVDESGEALVKLTMLPFTLQTMERLRKFRLRFAGYILIEIWTCINENGEQKPRNNYENNDIIDQWNRAGAPTLELN